MNAMRARAALRNFAVTSKSNKDKHIHFSQKINSKHNAMSNQQTKDNMLKYKTELFLSLIKQQMKR